MPPVPLLMGVRVALAIKGYLILWGHCYKHFTGCHDPQHDDTQQNDTQSDDTQHNDTPHTDTKHYNTQHDCTQQSNTQNATLRLMALSIKFQCW